jgi:GH15 family glucan-1,4-alpha-glucosidase
MQQYARGVKMNEYTRTYQPINSYGVIGNCHTALLIAPDGSVDWGCLPDFDSPALFCRLLDAERGGYFQLAPTDKTINASQRYLRGSNVLQTAFTGAMSSVVLTDFMPVAMLDAWLFRTKDNTAWTQGEEDGLIGNEGVFLPCTFWLIDNLVMQGRVTEARSLFERVLTCAGPLGLFSEEAEAGTGAALGNYPQALTHIALINTAVNLQRAELHLTRSRSVR